MMLELTDMLREDGHHVEFFAMAHPRNLPSENEDFFVSHVDYRSPDLLARARAMSRAVQQTVYSPESRRKLTALLTSKHYDVAHVHLVEHQISPSVLPVLRERGVPIVHTCHDHKLVCPESHLYCQPAGEVCERCVDSGSYYQVAFRRCMRGSFAVSALAGLAQYVHRSTGVFEKNVDVFVAPSRFLADRLVRGGIPGEKIRVLPNGLDLSRYRPSHEDDGYVLYFGRISVEKGLPTLVEAAGLVPHISFKLVGDGPAMPDLQALVGQRGLKNVAFLGYRRGEELRELIGRASVVVLSSECHENCPMALLEAYAMAKAVVATSVGGVPEIVDVGCTGHLVPPADPEALAGALSSIMADPSERRAMGQSARHKAESMSEGFFRGMLEIYEEARTMRSTSDGIARG